MIKCLTAVRGRKQPGQLDVRDWASYQCKPVSKCHHFFLLLCQEKPSMTSQVQRPQNCPHMVDFQKVRETHKTFLFVIHSFCQYMKMHLHNSVMCHVWLISLLQSLKELALFSNIRWKVRYSHVWSVNMKSPPTVDSHSSPSWELTKDLTTQALPTFTQQLQ